MREWMFVPVYMFVWMSISAHMDDARACVHGHLCVVCVCVCIVYALVCVTM